VTAVFHRVLLGVVAGALFLGLITPTSGSAAARLRAACQDTAHVAYAGGGWAGGRYAYHVNVGSLPGGRRTLRALINGHRTWDLARSPCRVRSGPGVHSRYAGATKRHFNPQPDGVSVVDFGSMTAVGLPANALAYTKVFYDTSGHIVETDQRYNARLRWSTTGSRHAYDVWGVAAHETGHSLGLDGDQLDSSHARLTMYGRVARGETCKRTLALGDLLALRAKYATP
jgi:hypothetical protein